MKYNTRNNFNLFEQPSPPGSGEPPSPSEGHAGRIMLNYYLPDAGIQIDFNNMIYTTPGGSAKIPVVLQHGKPVVITQVPVFPGGGWTIYSRPAKDEITGVVKFGLNYIHIVDPEGNDTTIKVVHGLTPKFADIRPNDITFILELGIAIGSGGGGGGGGGSVIDNPVTNPSGGGGGIVPGPLVGHAGGTDTHG
ncbi:MAG: hypothetical protein H8D80_01980 [Proteobacteria bacterium]|nr:hypothetical protein [Pseudomonadota bacterium]